jgi:hypothetical protein
MDYQFVLYEVRTGRIISCADTVSTESIVEGFELVVADLNKGNKVRTQGEAVDYICSGSYSDLSPDRYYVQDNIKVMPKSSFPKLDTSRNGLIRNIPEGTVVMWPDLQETVEDTGILEFDSNVSGVFEFYFSHPKYLSKTIEVEFHV